MKYNFDPELLPMVSMLADVKMDLNDLETSRAMISAMVESMNAEVDRSGVAIRDETIPEPGAAPAIAVRVYTPERQQQAEPVLLHIHGGGFVLGSLETEAGTCLALCRNLGITVVSVDYRLAPETPYPGGLEDCYAALLWMVKNADTLMIDPERIGVFGMSAGGGLSAATALLARDRRGPKICFQYLGIPELDDRLDTPSMLQFDDTPQWNYPSAILSWDYYLGADYQRGGNNVPAYAAPARAADLAGLPPAYISTMEFDPLRDEGVLYALKLMQAGVACELHAFPGTFHGSLLAESAQVHQRESAEMFAVLRRGLAVDASTGGQ